MNRKVFNFLFGLCSILLSLCGIICVVVGNLLSFYHEEYTYGTKIWLGFPLLLSGMVSLFLVVCHRNRTSKKQNSILFCLYILVTTMAFVGSILHGSSYISLLTIGNAPTRAVQFHAVMFSVSATSYGALLCFLFLNIIALLHLLNTPTQMQANGAENRGFTDLGEGQPIGMTIEGVPDDDQGIVGQHQGMLGDPPPSYDSLVVAYNRERGVSTRPSVVNHAARVSWRGQISSAADSSAASMVAPRQATLNEITVPPPTLGINHFVHRDGGNTVQSIHNEESTVRDSEERYENISSGDSEVRENTEISNDCRGVGQLQQLRNADNRDRIETGSDSSSQENVTTGHRPTQRYENSSTGDSAESIDRRNVSPVVSCSQHHTNMNHRDFIETRSGCSSEETQEDVATGHRTQRFERISTGDSEEAIDRGNVSSVVGHSLDHTDLDHTDLDHRDFIETRSDSSSEEMQENVITAHRTQRFECTSTGDDTENVDRGNFSVVVGYYLDHRDIGAQNVTTGYRPQRYEHSSTGDPGENIGRDHASPQVGCSQHVENLNHRDSVEMMSHCSSPETHDSSNSINRIENTEGQQDEIFWGTSNREHQQTSESSGDDDILQNITDIETIGVCANQSNTTDRHVATPANSNKTDISQTNSERIHSCKAHDNSFIKIINSENTEISNLNKGDFPQTNSARSSSCRTHDNSSTKIINNETTEMSDRHSSGSKQGRENQHHSSSQSCAKSTSDEIASDCDSEHESGHGSNSNGEVHLILEPPETEQAPPPDIITPVLYI